MKIVIFLFLTISLIFANKVDSTCKSCHSLIYNEYYSSYHANSSLKNNELHMAIWEIHPNFKTKNDTCKECHSPRQENIGISCIDCHQISNIKTEKNFNHNEYYKDPKYFFGADQNSKGKVKKFEKNDSFFGLVSSSNGSPYHTIDYSNQNFYDGKMCMGCHSHNTNDKNIDACRINFDNSKNQNCITCHMPQIKGSATSIKMTKTHAFHGFAGIYNKPNLLEKYLDIQIKTKNNRLDLAIVNKAPHDFSLHPFRIGVLKIKINNKLIKEYFFEKIFTKNGQISPTWNADKISLNSILKSNETRNISVNAQINKGDFIEIEFGMFPAKENFVKKLGLKNEKFYKYIPFKKSSLKI